MAAQKTVPGTNFVAAIDFGTSYSGYAFSATNDFKKNPVHISKIIWNSGATDLLSPKTPTCILFDKDKKFSAFGYEAETKYSELADDNKHKEWYFFRNFKMSLYDKQSLQRSFTFIDESKEKSMPASDVFSESIRYLKTEVMGKIRNSYHGIKESDVFWVVTVPAIWNETAKQFMYEAATKAGIEDARLMLALEPEAASIYCSNLKIESDGKGLIGLEPGSKYMVVDAGGGTVDITVHSVRENRVIDELFRASGGNWGGSYVDIAFMKFLEALFGSKVMQTFRKKSIDDMLDLQRDFEAQKRNMSVVEGRDIKLRIPISLLDHFKNTNEGKDITTRIKDLSLEEEVTIEKGKMKIGHLKARTFFEQAHRDLVSHIQQLFEKDQVRNVSTLLLVGGFSESRLLQEVIRESLPDKRIIIPPDPGLAVLKGAVIFGHNPSIIKTRISRYTYGFAIREYLTDQHLKDEAFSKAEITTDRKGNKRTDHRFSKHVTKGQALEVDEAQSSQTYCSDDGGDFTLCLYISHELDPVLVTDPSCHLIGKKWIAVSDLSDTTVHVNLRFGDTKIRVEVVKLETGERDEMPFDCLD